MGPVNDDDDMVTPAAAEVPVRFDPAKDAAAAAERGDDSDGVEERLAPGIEEAGYGYGV